MQGEEYRSISIYSHFLTSWTNSLRRFALGVLLALLFGTTSSAQVDWVDQFLNRYKPPNVDPAATVTPQVSDEPWRSMVAQGVLPLSVSDVIRLMLASNLDLTVNRFSPLANRYLLTTFFQPFEPTLNVSAQVARNTTPPTSQLQVGQGAVAVPFSQLTHRYSIGYGQTLQSGTVLGVNMNVNRRSDNSLFNTFNPSYFGTLTYSITQPFFRNYGRDINGWQIRIARNNVNLSEIDFELQMIDLVSAAENLYWDFVYQREDIKVRQQALNRAEKTLADNRRQVEIGTMARIEVVQAESEVAQRQEQMVTTTFTADQIQDQVKKLITNLGDPALVLAQLNPLDPLRKPNADDILPLEDAIKYALESRPELRQLETQQKNSDVTLQYAKNQLLPALILGATYTQNGLGGVQTNRSGLGGSDIISAIRGGLGDMFGQLFGYNYTGYSVGFNLSIPLSNKAEQAQYSKALADKQTIAARRTRLLQQIALEVRNAQSLVEMNRARIQAAEKALELAVMQSEAEQKKFQLGNSQLRFVLQEQRNVTDAQVTHAQALVNYAKSLVAYDRAIGRTLRKNNIEIEKQMQVAGLVQ
jgi:outer membrane protein